MNDKSSGWGGKLGEYYKGRGGQPQKYDDPVEIRIRCDRSWRDHLDSYLEQHNIKSRNQWLILLGHSIFLIYPI